MSYSGPGFVLAIIAMSMAAWVVTTWIRAKAGYPVENEWGGTVHRSEPATDRKIELLAHENANLTGKISRLEERISVLERIATETNSSSARLTDQINNLR